MCPQGFLHRPGHDHEDEDHDDDHDEDDHEDEDHDDDHYEDDHDDDHQDNHSGLHPGHEFMTTMMRTVKIIDHGTLTMMFH